MLLDPTNHIAQLCAQGMELEGNNDREAMRLFETAWTHAKNPTEQFVAAHYLARQQSQASQKLEWNQRALNLALTINSAEARECLASLYLNLAKDHEDMGSLQQAEVLYTHALQACNYLPEHGYKQWIRQGIHNGLHRITNISAPAESTYQP